MQFWFAGGLATSSRIADDEAYPAPHNTTGSWLPNVNFEVEPLLAEMYY